MRVLRFAVPLGLSALLALGAYVTFPGNDAFATTLSLTSLLFARFDAELESRLSAMIAAAEIDPDGRVAFNLPLGDQRFLEPGSGLYWQVTGEGHEPFASRSLGDRRIQASGTQAWTEPRFFSSNQFANEPLRVVERTVRLPGSGVAWQFVVARARD